MSSWEYKVVPAPTKGVKARGVKSAEARFANALETLMNDMGQDGWEYQRAETLPSVERSGLTGSTTEWRNLLVFRRTVTAPMDAFAPELLPAPGTVEAMPDTAPKTTEADMAEKAPQTADQTPERGNAPPPDAKPPGEPKDIMDVTASIKTFMGKDS